MNHKGESFRNKINEIYNKKTTCETTQKYVFKMKNNYSARACTHTWA